MQIYQPLENQDDNNGIDYGLVYARNIYEKNNLNINLQASMSTSNIGHVYLLALNFAFKHHDIIHNAKFEMEHTTDGEQRNYWTKYFDYNISHAGKHKLHKKTNISLDAKANRQSYQIDGTVNTLFKDISLSGNIAYANNFQSPNRSYIADFNVNNMQNLGLAINRHGLAWSADMPKTTGVMVKVKSAHKQHTFAVMLDGQEYSLKANRSLLLPASPLQPHDLEIIPNSLSSTIPDNQYSFILNRHNLKSYQFAERDIFMLMGNVITKDGLPVTKAFIGGAVTPGETDDEGFLDADVYANSTIKLEQPNGQPCWIDTSQFKPEDGMVYTNEIFCLEKSIKY